jgi:phosphate-selective porin OprO/OprP
VIGLVSITASAHGQGYPAVPIGDSSIIPLPQTTPEAYLPATYLADDAKKKDDGKKDEGKKEADLSKRVADLEKTLTDMRAKEAEAKKKVAGAPTFIPGGRIFFDTYFFDQSDASHALYGNAENTVWFRAARLQVKGDAFNNISYQIEMDFGAVASTTPSTSPVAFKDTFITLRELPYAGNMIVGHFKEPVGLEQRLSDNYITFMERSLPDVLVPGRNMGLSFFDWSENERMTWMIGTFAVVPENPPTMINDNGPVSLAGRITYLPWYDEATEGRGLMHVGLGARYQDADEGQGLRFSARPEVGNFTTVAPKAVPAAFTGIVDTGTFDARGYSLLVPEAALVYGPFSLQSEWMGVRTAGFRNTGDAFLWGYYVQASYFLTGEHRRYLRRLGLFDRVRPFENFFRVRTCDGTVATGLGAWEVAYRYSQLDLNDFGAGVRGGEAFDHTFGVNWYWNPYTRVMFNYVNSTSEDVPTAANGLAGGTQNIFETRVQIDF